MGVQISPNSELGKELRKWEQHHTQYTMGEDEQGNSLTPGNPYRYRPFPAMLYKAVERNGKAFVIEPPPNPLYFDKPQDYQRAELMAESLSRGNMRKVHSEEEKRRAYDEGWRDSPTEALAFYEELQQAMGDAAAEAAFTAQRMTEKARAEFAEAEQQTHRHVVDVKPARKRGRPAKGVVAQTGVGPVEE